MPYVRPKHTSESILHHGALQYPYRGVPIWRRCVLGLLVFDMERVLTKSVFAERRRCSQRVLNPRFAL